MYRKFISKNDEPRLILIFADWATDWHIFEGLEHPGYDIAVISNYSDLSFKWRPFFNYDEIVLIGWGFGVFIASLTAHEIMPRVTLRIAVNGTLDAVSDTRGMHLLLFDKLRNNLTPSNLWQYWRRMAQSADDYAQLLDCRPSRTISSLIAELQEIDTQLIFHAPQITDWDFAIAGRQDVIFPHDNQAVAWDGICPVISVSKSHYIDFKEIIDKYVVKKNVNNSNSTDAAATTELLLKTICTFTGVEQLEGDVLNIVDCDSLPGGKDVEAAMLCKSSNSLMYIVGPALGNIINSPKIFLQQCRRVLVQSGIVALAIRENNGDIDHFNRWINAVPADTEVFVSAVKKLSDNYLFLVLRKC